MKKILYITIVFWGVCLPMHGNSWGNDKQVGNSPLGFASVDVSEDNLDPSFLYGAWCADDGSHVYIPNGFETVRKNKWLHAYYECESGDIYYSIFCSPMNDTMQDWYVSVPYRERVLIDSGNFQDFLNDYTAMMEPVEAVGFQYYADTDALIRDSDEMVFHRDSTIQESLINKMNEKIRVYNLIKDEYIEYEKEQGIPSDMSWIFGEWIDDWYEDDIKTFTIKKPNLIRLNGSDRWLEFGVYKNGQYREIHVYIDHYWETVFIEDDKYIKEHLHYDGDLYKKKR